MQTASDIASEPAARAARDYSRFELNLWEHVSLTVTHAMVAALLACLSLAGLYRVGRLFGTLEWLVNYKRRRRFARALARVLGRKPTGVERRRETRKFFMRTRCDKLLYLILDCVRRDQAEALLSIENRSLLEDALARGRGVYLAMSHFGAQHVIAMLLATKGYKTVGVRDRNESPLRRYVQKRYEQRYPEFAFTRWLFADAYPRDIFRCLQDGYMVGSALDASRVRTANQRTQEVTIFGETQRFPSGPLHIAIRCGAPILQALIVPERNFRYRFEFTEMLVDPEQVTDEDAAVADAMRAYAANIERHARERPSLIGRI